MESNIKMITYYIYAQRNDGITIPVYEKDLRTIIVCDKNIISRQFKEIVKKMIDIENADNPRGPKKIMINETDNSVAYKYEFNRYPNEKEPVFNFYYGELKDGEQMDLSSYGCVCFSIIKN